MLFNLHVNPEDEAPMKRRFGLGLATAFAIALTTVVMAQQSAAPVADAAKRGDLATVRSLLKQGADASSPQPDGMTPLHWAAERGEIAIADALILAGANVTAATRLGGYTPLHLAARNGNAPVLKALLKAGAQTRRCHRRPAPLHCTSRPKRAAWTRSRR